MDKRQGEYKIKLQKKNVDREISMEIQNNNEVTNNYDEYSEHLHRAYYKNLLIHLKKKRKININKVNVIFHYDTDYII